MDRGLAITPLAPGPPALAPGLVIVIMALGLAIVIMALSIAIVITALERVTVNPIQGPIPRILGPRCLGTHLATAV